MRDWRLRGLRFLPLPPHLCLNTLPNGPLGLLLVRRSNATDRVLGEWARQYDDRTARCASMNGTEHRTVRPGEEPHDHRQRPLSVLFTLCNLSPLRPARHAINPEQTALARLYQSEAWVRSAVCVVSRRPLQSFVKFGEYRAGDFSAHFTLASHEQLDTFLQVWRSTDHSRAHNVSHRRKHKRSEVSQSVSIT